MAFNLASISKLILDRMNPKRIRKNGPLTDDQDAQSGYMDPFPQPATTYGTPKPPKRPEHLKTRGFYLAD
jgi:hypothetical protein